MNPLNHDVPVTILSTAREAVKRKRTDKHGPGYALIHEGYVRAMKREEKRATKQRWEDYASAFARFNNIDVSVAKVDPECKRAYEEDIPAIDMMFRSTYMKREDCREFNRF